MVDAAAVAAVAPSPDVAAPSPGDARTAVREPHGLTLPFARVKRIVRENTDVKNISVDANFVAARAAVRLDLAQHWASTLLPCLQHCMYPSLQAACDSVEQLFA
jgi:Histone-like transcription factor (CBF/NF-Y) and archaeal histone